MTLYGVDELARAAGCKPKTLTAYLTRGKCPPPSARLKCGPVWTEEAVASWLEARDARLESLEAGGELAFTAAVDDAMNRTWDWGAWRGVQARMNAGPKSRRRRTVKDSMRLGLEQDLRAGRLATSSGFDETIRRSERAGERLAARRAIRGDDGIPF